MAMVPWLVTTSSSQGWKRHHPISARSVLPELWPLSFAGSPLRWKSEMRLPQFKREDCDDGVKDDKAEMKCDAKTVSPSEVAHPAMPVRLYARCAPSPKGLGPSGYDPLRQLMRSASPGGSRSRCRLSRSSSVCSCGCPVNRSRRRRVACAMASADTPFLV
jgi:hypothetical protein